MLPVAEMDLEVVHRHSRAGGVELARAIMAPDTGEILVFQSVGGDGGGVGHGMHGSGVDGSVTHYAFKGIIGICAL